MSLSCEQNTISTFHSHSFDNEYDDLFEEYKSDEEFEDSDVMDTPLRKAMRDAET
jgi:hypothetical protein